MPSSVRRLTGFLAGHKGHNAYRELGGARHVHRHELNARSLKSKEDVRVATEAAQARDDKHSIMGFAYRDGSFETRTNLIAPRSDFRDLLDQKPAIAKKPHDGFTLRFQSKPGPALAVG